MKNDKLYPVGMRLPAEMAEWLKKQAAANQRSVSNQAVWMLSQIRAQQTQGATQ